VSHSSPAEVPPDDRSAMSLGVSKNKARLEAVRSGPLESYFVELMVARLPVGGAPPIPGSTSHNEQIMNATIENRGRRRQD
jgi:hypothetical protein